MHDDIQLLRYSSRRGYVKREGKNVVRQAGQGPEVRGTQKIEAKNSEEFVAHIHSLYCYII